MHTKQKVSEIVKFGVLYYDFISLVLRLKKAKQLVRVRYQELL